MDEYTTLLEAIQRLETAGSVDHTEEALDKMRLAQKYIVAQAKEIEQLKTQLANFRWRPVSEPPLKDGWYFIRYEKNDTENGFWDGDKWRYCAPGFTHWTPAPPLENTSQ